ncbi:tyrosine-type recombinase/integrase [Alloalcanivorax xenomutans]|uniref:tyrosine-type recombinase/integrase n=1 Tax=Alloalcanivorax xenomutans TaxID=1094342 RepID=UPI003BAD3781
MPRVKLTKTIVAGAQPGETDIELRDTLVPGFFCKVTPTGRKVFMLQYRTNSGKRRKPSLGLFGELTVEQARTLAQDLLADVRRGNDPSGQKARDRQAPTVKDLCKRFMEDHCIPHNKPLTQKKNQYHIDKYLLPSMGTLKVHEVERADILALMKRLEKTPTQANRILACVHKMFNLAELWGYRPDGTNPCRHVTKFPEKGKTRLLTDKEMILLFRQLEKTEEEEFEHPSPILGIRLQFAFAARMSEILALRWEWVDLVGRRVVWPDSKTGDMSKPISSEAYELLSDAAIHSKSEYVCPALEDPNKPLTQNAYYGAWRRILKRAGIPLVGTHGIRHRAATDIANSGIPIKVGMALTAHKTVTMFMRYVHVEDDPVREAAELVANRRQIITRLKSNKAEP